MNIKESPTTSELGIHEDVVLSLHDIALDRKINTGSSNAAFNVEGLSSLTPEQSEIVQENIRLLESLNGHRGADIRRVTSSGSTPEAVFIKSLYDFSFNLISDQPIDWSPVLEKMPASLIGLGDIGLYERVLFLEKYPDTDRQQIDVEIQKKTAEALGVKSEKWIDLIEPLFDNPDSIADVLENVGFIPDDVFTKKKFKNVDPKKIVEATIVLRGLNENQELSHLALHERSHIINHFFISRRAELLRIRGKQNISLDSNGLSINLNGFYSHIPYGLIDDETIEEFVSGNWLDEHDILEIRIQKAQSNNRPSTVKDAIDAQDKMFSEALSYTRDSFIDALVKGDIKSMAEQVVSNNLTVPDMWIDAAISKGIHIKLLVFAEEISALLSGRISDNELNLVFGDPSIDAADEAYELRSKILNSPSYYSVSKIVKQFIVHSPLSSAEHEYVSFRGQYKKSKDGEQHSFISALHHGELARVLINENKHVSPQVRPSLESMPMFDRGAYESLENALRTFNSFSSSLEKLKLLQSKHIDGSIKGIDSPGKIIEDSVENCLHFLLTNVSGKYNQADALYKSLFESGSLNTGALHELVAVFTEAEKEYSVFFYKNVLSQSLFEEKFSPEIAIDDVKFGDEFVHEAEQVCPSKFDTTLSETPFTIRTVSVDYKMEDPSATIPFHIEESCLDALRIDRNRPLINIIGGCKELDSKENPLDMFSDAVVQVAHKYKANVGVPGTQSGIGTVFGKQNIEYMTRFEHLPHAERAHLFAINPGGSVFFPGNKFIDSASGSVYGNTSVDTLVTPVAAEWSKKGLDKYTSKYLTHVAYMEALYHRMSVDQKQVLVVGNGGLYSIMEINEALKRDVRLVLVQNTGRFAEASSILIPRAEEILESPNPHERILEILRDTMDEKSVGEFLNKDFGEQILPENDDYVVYRDFFMKFLTLIKDRMNHVSVVELDSLQDTLDQVLQSE